MCDNISHFQDKARQWNSDIFGHVGRKKRRLKSRILGIEKAMESKPTLNLLQLEHELILEYEDTCLQEELIWMQKSREKWIKFGDRNTTYFHTKAAARHRRNKILTLQDSAGEWQTDQPTLESMATEYFKHLYTKDDHDLPTYTTKGLFPSLDTPTLSLLQRDISLEETKEALFNSNPHKAPGEDGLTALFYQSQWDKVHKSIFSFVKESFQGQNIPQTLNSTLIALIPKIDHPKCLKEFRPISLCTVAYKILTKIIATRLKVVMPTLTLPYQTSFISGRNITDNIIMAQEVIHTMKRKTGKNGWFALKVDLEKAFDRLRWEFIEDTLRDARIPDSLIQLIMRCISSASMKVLWNGKPLETFRPSRGVR